MRNARGNHLGYFPRQDIHKGYPEPALQQKTKERVVWSGGCWVGGGWNLPAAQPTAL